MLGAPAVAWLIGWAFLALRSRVAHSGVLNPVTWGRFDSGQYLNLARLGYDAQYHCPRNLLPPHLAPGNYLCGRVSWFPGYPLAIRGLSEVTRLSLLDSALIIAWVGWFAVLVVMWQLVRGARPATRWGCLLLAAFAPGQVYFAALFPISYTVAAMLGCLYFAYRVERRGATAAAIACGVIAGSGYISAIVLAPALVLGALIADPAPRRRAFAAAGGVAAGFAAVLLAMQFSVGIWDAYFIAQRKFTHGYHLPWTTLVASLRPLWTTPPSRPGLHYATAQQSLYTAGLVALVLLAAGLTMARRRGVTLRARIEALDLTLVLATVGVWLLPNIAGGSLSVWRSEAFVIVGIPLLRRLPAWALVVSLSAAVVVSSGIAHYFFTFDLA